MLLDRPNGSGSRWNAPDRTGKPEFANAHLRDCYRALDLSRIERRDNGRSRCRVSIADDDLRSVESIDKRR